MRLILPLILLPSFALLSTPAAAGDGVAEINQTCAVQTGCFPGDTAGFPVTIDGSVGRSYRLTSDLLLPDRDTTAIEITRRDTSIDLNGFQIILSLCQSLNCGPVVGSGYGILGPSTAGVSVFNGSIVATGQSAVSLFQEANVSNLRVRWNGEDGIVVGAGSQVRHSIVEDTGGTGIQTGSDSIVSENVIRNNSDQGIFAGQGSTISNNTVAQNGLDGIVASLNSVVDGNTVRDNDDGGIDAASGSTILNNSVYSNGGGANSAGDTGIECDAGCLVRGNVTRANTGYGISLSFDSAYRENVVSANTTGTVAGTGNNRGDNYCSGSGVGSAFCP